MTNNWLLIFSADYDARGVRHMRMIYIAIGTITLLLGTIGIFAPILPTVPFYLITLYCYSRSSKRLHDWFVNSNMYERNLRTYAKKEGMTIKTKLKIIISVTVIMGLSFYMMAEVLIGRIVLSIIWLVHIIYFGFIVSSIKEKE